MKDLRRAVALREGLASLPPLTRFDHARNHALLAGLASEPSSGVSTSEVDAEADRAITELKRSVAQGYRTPGMKTNPDFAPIRGRPEFRAIMCDLDFPTDPFAHNR